MRLPPLARREPSLLWLTRQRLQHNLAGLRELLQPTAAQEARLLQSHPTVLRSAPALLLARFDMLRELLQVSGGAHGNLRAAAGSLPAAATQHA